MIDWVLSRRDFYDAFFNAYNDEVKRGRYSKIPYLTWRTIRDWLCCSEWTDYEIGIIANKNGYLIELLHDKYTCPEPVQVDFLEDSDGFAEYLIHREEWLSEFSLNNSFEEKPYKAIKEKENKETMNFNFDFGPVDSTVRLSPYGMAIKNASGSYVAYDSKSKQVVNVDIFNFEGANKFIYKMPVAIKDVAAGDVVIHARKPAFVIEVLDNMRLRALDIYDGEEKIIVLTRSPFNFDFVTKVVSLINLAGTANSDNPFGGMLPFLLMSDTSNDNLLPLLMLSQGGDFAQNPMMLWALAGNQTNDPMLLAMLMAQGGFGKQ